MSFGVRYLYFNVSLDNVTIYPEDAKVVKNILWPDEKVEATGRQRRVGPGASLTTPTSIVATDKRVIIVNRSSLGIRKDYEEIPYRQITSVRLEHGLVASSIFLRVQGFSNEKGLLKMGDQEGEIDGMNNGDARAIADFISKKLEAPEDVEVENPKNGSDSSGAVYCSKCGASNPRTASFCSKCGAKLVS